MRFIYRNKVIFSIVIGIYALPPSQIFEKEITDCTFGSVEHISSLAKLASKCASETSVGHCEGFLQRYTKDEERCVLKVCPRNQSLAQLGIKWEDYCKEGWYLSLYFQFHLFTVYSGKRTVR